MITEAAVRIFPTVQSADARREIGDYERVAFYVKRRDPLTGEWSEALPNDVVVIADPPGADDPLVYATTHPDPTDHPGYFTCEFPLTVEGNWKGRIVATGNAADVVESFSFVVKPRLFDETSYEETGTPAPIITGYLPLAWTQPVWRIDPVNGIDTNVGDDAHPLKTCNELYRRRGPAQFYDDVRVTITDDLIAGDVLHLEGLVLKPGLTFPNPAGFPGYRVVGVPKLVASGTITNVRAWDQAGNIEWGIETSLGNMSTHIRAGRIFVRTTGNPTYPDRFYLAKNENGTMHRLSFPHHASAGDEVDALFMTSPLVIGDTFSIYDMPKIPRAVIESESASWGLLLSGLNFTSPTVPKGTFTARECCFQNLGLYDGGAIPQFSNCQYTGAFLCGPGAGFYAQGGLALNAFRVWHGAPSFQNYFMFQGGLEIAGNGGAVIHCHTRGFSVHDQASDGLIVFPGNLVTFAGCLMGSGNGGYGVNVKRGGKMIVGGLGASSGAFFRATGTLGDISVGGRSSGPAIDPSTYAYTSARAYSYLLFNDTVANGGFGQRIEDPTMKGHGIFPDY